MNSDNFPTNKSSSEAGSISETSKSSLLKFVENETASPSNDINTKITALDTDLLQLREELSTINSSVEEGLDRLGDTDTDLTAKISETYKRLGEIDNAYKSLIEISSRIDNDIQKLNGDVSTIAVRSADGIKTLEHSSVVQTNEFTHKNEQLVSKVNHLVETTKLAGELQAQKIKLTTERMLQIEKSVVTQIVNLSSESKDKTQSIEVSVESNKARILKLQSVDEAIIKRATTLEISSAELTVRNQAMQSSVEQLQASADDLSDGLSVLREKTRALEDIANNHGSLINSLQKSSTEVMQSVNLLSRREGNHFNLTAIGLFLLVLIISAMFFIQQQLASESEKQSEHSSVLDARVSTAQQTHDDELVLLNNTLASLEDKLDVVSSELQDELKKEVVMLNLKTKSLQDQVQSVDGRLSQSSPFSLIGSDNVIHGAQWISALPADNFVVQLAYVNTKKELYEIAQRYNYYLKDVLSFFEVKHNGKIKYVLLSGNYSSRVQASTQQQAMPRYINWQKPVVKKLESVQAYLAQDDRKGLI